MPEEKSVRSEPLGDDDEHVDQQAVGRDNVEGGGEFPDPDTPPDEQAGAPGPELVGHREHGQGQFNDAQERADG